MPRPYSRLTIYSPVEVNFVITRMILTLLALLFVLFPILIACSMEQHSTNLFQVIFLLSLERNLMLKYSSSRPYFFFIYEYKKNMRTMDYHYDSLLYDKRSLAKTRRLTRGVQAKKILDWRRLFCPKTIGSRVVRG